MPNFISPILPILPQFLSLQEWLENAIVFMVGAGADMLTSMAATVMKFGDSDALIATQMIRNITGPAGFMLMIFSFMGSFINKWKNGNEPSVDDFARPGFFLIVGDIALTRIGDIIGLLMGWSNSLGTRFNDYAQLFQKAEAAQLTAQANLPYQALDDAAAAAGEHGAVAGAFAQFGADYVKTLVQKSSIVGLTFTFLMTFIGFLLTLVAAAFLFVVLLSAKVEIMLRFIFAPIGIASMADETKRDDSFRYLKKMLASAFYLAGIQMALHYTMYFGIDNINPIGNLGEADGFVSILFTLEAAIFRAALPFSAVGVVSIAKNVVNEAFSS